MSSCRRHVREQGRVLHIAGLLYVRCALAWSGPVLHLQLQRAGREKSCRLPVPLFAYCTAQCCTVLYSSWARLSLGLVDRLTG